MTTDLDTIRCSSLPSALRCPGAARPPLVRIRRQNDAADVGTEAHRLMERVVLNLPIEQPEDVETRVLLAYGRRCWEELREAFPSPQTEVAFSAFVAIGVDSDNGITLTGHIDLLSVMLDERRAAIADWKTGRCDSEHRDQLMGYALGVYRTYPEIDRVDVTPIWLRDQTYEPFTVTRAEAEAWGSAMAAVLLEWDGTFHPGTHCVHCDRSHDCPAIVAESRRDVAIFAEMPPTPEEITAGVFTLAPKDVAFLVRRARAVATIADNVVRAAKLRVRTQPDVDFSDGAGRRLVIDTQERRELDTWKAWPVLQELLTDEELSTCMTFAIGAAEDVVAKKAQAIKPRTGKAAKEAMGAALEAAGAVRKTEHTVLKDVRVT